MENMDDDGGLEPSSMKNMKEWEAFKMNTRLLKKLLQSLNI